jgi:hypothetical protein
MRGTVSVEFDLQEPFLTLQTDSSSLSDPDDDLQMFKR